MPPKAQPKKTAFLSIALAPNDRKVMSKAAGILGLPPSVWGRATLLTEANKIISESKAAK